MFRRDLEKILEEKLKAYSFKKKKGEYIKIVDGNIVYSIGFAFSSCGEKETYYVNVVVGVSYSEITSFIHRLSEDNDSCRVSTPMGYLMTPPNYKEWKVAKIEDVDKATDIIIEDITKYAFPFFDKMSDIDNFAEAFAHQSYASTCGRDDYILPAYYYFINKKDCGEAYVKEAFAKRAAKENKYYLTSYTAFAKNYLQLISEESE